MTGTNTWLGREIVDLRHEPIGKVVDVLYNDSGGGDQPELAIVNPGLFKSAYCVPVTEHARTGTGEIVVPFEASKVKQSPKAPKDHVLTVDIREAIASHYNIQI